MSAKPRPICSESSKTREKKFLLLIMNCGIRKENIGDYYDEEELRSLNWEVVVEKAFENRIATLLYQVLRESSKMNSVPALQINVLKRFNLETIQWNLRIKSCTCRILKKFEECNIKALLLKGGFLAYYAWPSMAMRQMHDIDIVVPRDRAKDAFDAIISEGFEFTGEKTFSYYLEFQKDFPYFVERNSRINIELHHKIFTPNQKFYINENEFWENSQSYQLFDREIQALGCNELLIHLCLHVSLGHFMDDMIRSLLDICFLKKCRWFVLDEDRLISWLESPKWGPLLALPLYMTENYFGTKWVINDWVSREVLDSHFEPWKIVIIDNCIERYIIKNKDRSILDIVYRRTARTILYNPNYGLFRILLDFVMVHEDISMKHESITFREKMWSNFRRIFRIMRKILKKIMGRN